MTKSISSRSVKATPKMADEPDTNGTPLIAPDSEDTFAETVWTIKYTNGREIGLGLAGHGRISFTSQRGGGELRIYRNETTKVFDAVLTGVESVISHRCTKVSDSHSIATASSSISKVAPKLAPMMAEEEIPPWLVGKKR